MTIYSHKFLTDCKLSELRIALINTITNRIVAQSVDCSLEIPRQVARQQHRANAPATTPCEYWRINLFFPFIDHLMTQFDERFPESSRNMYLGYYLIPKHLPQLDDEKLKAIRESYQADLPSEKLYISFSRPSNSNCVERYTS